jgi:predicted enzyme related to lactoylglutathione lyase
MTASITIQGVYACAIVKDFDAGLAWYTKFMGRPADDLPFPGMAQWRNMGAAGLQLWEDAERAGQAIMTVVVQDLGRETVRLGADGIVVQNEARGVFGAVGQVVDPEGNRINLTEPPKGFVNG